MILPAIVTVTAALILYTAASWMDILSRKNRITIVILFWMGLAADISATVLMSLVSEGFKMDTHGIIGLTALFLMFIKSVYSLVNFVKHKGEVKNRGFFRRSIAFSLWIFWVGVFIHGAAVH